MDFLQAEIQRKRKEVESKLKAVSTEKPRTFFKRGDLEPKVKRPAPEEEPIEKQDVPSDKREKLSDSEGESEKKSSTKQTSESTAAKQPEATKIRQPERQKSLDAGELPLSRFEVSSRFRERRQPIRLFGESDAAAFDRLRRAEMSELSDLQPGFKNDFKAAFDKLDEDFLAELVREQEERERGSVATTSQGNAGKLDVRVSKSVELDIEKWSSEIGRGETHRDADIVLHYLKHILNRWGQQLNARSFDEKAAYSGRLESARHATTCEYIRPLFKLLRTHVRLNDPASTAEQKARYANAGRIDVDMLDSLGKIVAACLRRDYLSAGDGYVELAIGNACWPLGVTNHGIHARTAQEKIHAKNVAHVLNDETQRKFIQAAKRLLTIAETYYPPTSASCASRGKR